VEFGEVASVGDGVGEVVKVEVEEKDASGLDEEMVVCVELS
jgi:hypothetical protein